MYLLGLGLPDLPIIGSNTTATAATGDSSKDKFNIKLHVA